MEFVRETLESQPLLALFLTIAIGFAVGEISIKGFSLGGGAVLFVALGVGCLAPKSAPDVILGNFGLALFLYMVGIQYGKLFFKGLTSMQGLKANLAALVGVLVAGVVSLLLIKWMNLKAGYALGLFAGSGTSTSTLQATIATLGNDDPAVGYSVAYPFGVAGPILILYVTFLFLKPSYASHASTGVEMMEVVVRRREFLGKPLRETMTTLPTGVQIVAVRRDGRNQAATPEAILAEHDVLLIVAPTRNLLDQVAANLGEAATGQLIPDRRDLDYLRVFASRPSVVGRALGELALPGGQPAVVAHVRRGDVEITLQPDLVLEFGDRIGILAHRDDFPALRAFFGDSIKGTAEFSYITIGLGMALGFLLGAIHIPIPGIGSLTLGLSGVLIVALVLGKVRRTGGLNWTIPISANLVMRNLGLTVFLAQVGMASGPKFAATIADTGILMLLQGAVILIALVLPVLILCLLVFRMSFDEFAGILAGATGNPAILAYANKLTPSDQPDAGYAMIFPGMTIMKILFASIAASLL